MNCSLWTVVLVETWIYKILTSYSRGKPWFHNVSKQGRFDMSPFLLKTLDWAMKTLTSTLGSSLDSTSLWSHGKWRNLACWPTTYLTCLQTLPGNWKTLLINITVNSFLIILDVQHRFLIASLQWIVTRFNYSGSFKKKYNLLSTILTWLGSNLVSFIHIFIASVYLLMATR